MVLWDVFHVNESKTPIWKYIQPTPSFSGKRYPFLRHAVSREGIQADPESTSSVNMYPVAKNVTERKSFLNPCSYCERYVKQTAKIARSLQKLTEKRKGFFWNSKSQETYGVLKARRTSASTLAFPGTRTFQTIYWCYPAYNRCTSRSSPEWFRTRYLLRILILQQSSKPMFHYQAWTFGFCELHQTFQTLLIMKNIPKCHWSQSLAIAS